MKSARIALICIATPLALLAGDGASAQVITEFSAGITSPPLRITAGPDGLWFTEPNVDRIGRITPLGVVTEFGTGITAGANPYDITAGPDGNLWFTEPGNLSLVAPGIDRIGRITPQGVVTEFNAGITAGAKPNGITAGADGNLWFTEPGVKSIGRITPQGVVTEFSLTGTIGVAGPVGPIATGPDGNVWFAASGGDFWHGTFIHLIVRMSPAGVVTTFNDPLFVTNITMGSDGNMWFTESVFNRIGRITPLRGVAEFSAGLSSGAFAFGITAGPDGNLWFTEGLGARIGRITPDGVVTHFGAGISKGASTYGITTGPDGNLWFTEPQGDRIGRITPCQGACLPPCQGACLPTTTTVVSSAHRPHSGHPIVFTASVIGNFPTGTVQFLDGGAPLGSPVGLSGGGVAQLMTSTLTPGKHSITAVYSGDANNASSASAVLVQRVH